MLTGAFCVAGSLWFTFELPKISAIMQPIYQNGLAGHTRHSLAPTLTERKITVNWPAYLACFFAGMFLANVVPHFVHGISGDRFPTPFARPPGKGLSSPTINVVWALLNLVVGYILFRAGRVSSGDDLATLAFFAGIAAISIMLSIQFAKKQVE
jgi:hypothetical protein